MFEDTIKEIMDQLEAYGPYFELETINDNTADGLCSITIDGSKINLEELAKIVEMFSNYPEFAPTSTVKTDDKIVYYFKDNRNAELDETSDNEKNDKKIFLMSPSEFRANISESNTKFDKLFGVKEADDQALASSQSNIRDYGKKIDSNDQLDIFERDDKRNGKIYTMIERNPKGEFPLVYIYSLNKGNLTRGAENLWARQEILSASKAFHKDRPNKMAIPNNLEKAIEVATENSENYTPKK